MTAPFMRLNVGDLLIIEGVRWRVQARDQEAISLHADGHGDRALSWSGLADLYRANRLERRSAAIAALEATDPSLAERARRSLAGLDAKTEAETLKRILHVSLCGEIFERRPADRPAKVKGGRYALVAALAFEQQCAMAAAGNLPYPAPTKPCSRRTLRRWLATFLRSDRSYRALVPQHDAKGPRTSTLDPRVFEIAKCVLNELWLTGKRPEVKSAFDEIADRIEAAQANGQLPSSIAAPGVRTLYRLIDRDPELRRELDRRNGKDPADQRHRSVKVRPLVHKPLAEVQIDDAELPINVWSDEDGKIVVGHPTLTLIIDVCTRMVLGFYLSLKPPCAETARLAMLNAIQEKPAPGPGRPKTPWPAHGLPELLLSDRGKNFIAVVFMEPCADLGFEPRQAPPYHPWLRGHIERLIKTLKRLLYARLLKDMIFDPPPGGADRTAAVADLSLKDLERIILHYIVDRYHTNPHRGLNWERPFDCWMRLTADPDNAPIMPDQVHEPLIFGITAEAPIGREGVVFEGIHYGSKELDAILRRRGSQDRPYRLGADPKSLAFIILFDPETGTWIKLDRVNPPEAASYNLQDWRKERRRHCVAGEKRPYREAQRDAERVADDIIAKAERRTAGEAEIDEPEAAACRPEAAPPSAMELDDVAVATGAPVDAGADAVPAWRRAATRGPNALSIETREEHR